VASAELNTLVAFPQFDTDAFAVATDISITLLAEGFFVATGGTGQGFVTGSGSFQGSGSGGATFDSFSAINNVACDDLLGTCQQLIPITFGQPFQIIALANASIHRTDAGVSSAAGTGDASVLQIYDANRNLLPDAQLHLVPEPASLMLLFTGLVCLLIQKRVVQHKLAEIRQRCRW
jgi:hypothetical protein